MKFIADCLKSARLYTHVRSIRGGGDSSTVGRFAYLAVEGLHERGYDAKYVPMRLPYGSQRDETADAVSTRG